MINLVIIELISLIVIVILSTFFHELGHILMGRLYGFNWEWIKFNRVKIFGTKNYDPSKQAFVIGIAGGLFSFMFINIFIIIFYLVGYNFCMVFSLYIMSYLEIVYAMKEGIMVYLMAKKQVKEQIEKCK